MVELGILLVAVLAAIGLFSIFKELYNYFNNEEF